MPSAAEILQGLATIANSWHKLAAFWHIYFGLFVVAASFGWRPPNRLAGALLIPPMVSVSVLAWMEANPVNGTLFGVLSVVLVASIRRLSITPVERASRIWIVLGSLLFGFGWVYPHFLEGERSLTYLYAAPLGLVPCPTLSMATGIAIIFSGFRSRTLSLVLTSAAVSYGIFGSLYLGVTIDWVLTVGGIGLLVLSMSKTVANCARAA